jgi:hypothetical protein
MEKQTTTAKHMKKRINSTLLLSAVAMLLGSATATAQIAVPESFAHPISALNTSKPGFKVRPVQADYAGTLENTVARAEAQLAGVLKDPTTDQVFGNVADIFGFDSEGFYNEELVIGYEANGGSEYGLYFPGIPGTTLNGNNYSVEVLTYLNLSPGTYSMTVNSDDGFRVTVGPDARDQFSSIELAVYDGGRGSADSNFKFTIAKAGAYSFRIVYFQGGGGANLYWTSGEGDQKQYVNETLAPGGIKAYRELSGATSPYIQLLTPAVNAKTALPNSAISGTIVDSATAQVLPASVSLTLDGAVADAKAQKTGNKTTYSFQPTSLLKSLSVHQVKLVFSDSTGTVRTSEYSFTVRNYLDVTLPEPFYKETFDAVAEGELPAGWSVENHSSGAGAGEDLNNSNSDSFLDWVVISRDRVQAIGWDSVRRLNVQPGQFVNGKEVTSLVNGNFIYAESDTRGGSQVQYLLTPDIDCSGKNNVFVVFNNIYEQNQDSIGSAEYSIDSGATWLPILYMIDGVDIVKATDGNIDGYATLNNTNGDTAHLEDPVTSQEIGLKYGAFIGVKSNLWSTLSPFISARVNDDPVESKRVELFRLPKADNQAKVRFRFAQAGTGSWYFGIDDLGLYEINQALPPKITKNPEGQTVSAGAQIVMSVTATGEELAYQWKHDGSPISGATGSTLTLSNVQAAAAGQYLVVVSNPGGEVTSSPTTVKVFSGTITQDLVAHLTFDDNLQDSSGKGNNGSPVGAPTFSAGKIGRAVHIPSGSDYVTLGAPADLNFGTDTDFSLAFWAKDAESSGDPSFIGNKDWNSGGNAGYVLATDGDLRLQWNLAGAPGSRKDYDGPGGTFADKGWHHVVVTFTRSRNAVSYVDGVAVSSNSLTANANNVDTPSGFATNIGQDGTGSYGSAFTDLDVDDLGIWRRSLTVQEVAAIYAAGSAGKDLATVTVGGGTSSSALGIARSGTSISITWSGSGAIQSADSITGPWTDVQSASSPLQVSPSGSAKFYRLKP